MTMFKCSEEEMRAALAHLNPTQLAALHRDLSAAQRRITASLDAFTMPDHLEGEDATRYTYGIEPLYAALEAEKLDYEELAAAVWDEGCRNAGEEDFRAAVAARY
jgi:hypothetical protein